MTIAKDRSDFLDKLNLKGQREKVGSMIVDLTELRQTLKDRREVQRENAYRRDLSRAYLLNAEFQKGKSGFFSGAHERWRNLQELIFMDEIETEARKPEEDGLLERANDYISSVVILGQVEVDIASLEAQITKTEMELKLGQLAYQASIAVLGFLAESNSGST